MELEYEANPQYDASGIGRIHRRGAPAAICLSVPVSATPKYITGDPNPHGMAICGGVFDGNWQYALEADCIYQIHSHSQSGGIVTASWSVTLPCEKTLVQSLKMDNGVTITTQSTGRAGLMLPAFDFDGENKTIIEAAEHSLSIRYQGWICRYATDGSIVDTGNLCMNRNGQYRIFRAENDSTVTVKVTITQE